MEGPDVHTSEAVIDNGSFGTRTIRFETGRLARQAAGSVVAYLDDETRSRLIAAFTAAFTAHESSDGTVAFDAPYAVITARRR